MKKLTVLALAVVLAMFLAACSNNGDAPSTNDETAQAASQSNSGTASSPSSATESTPEPEPEASTPPEAQPTPSDEGHIGDSHVKILDASFAEDYEGKPIIVINFEFTNNDEDAKAFLFSASVNAYQDGVELDSLVIVMDDTIYDVGLAQKELKTGASLVVQKAFQLSSESPIEVEVAEFISFDDTPVLTKTFTVE